MRRIKGPIAAVTVALLLAALPVAPADGFRPVLALADDGDDGGDDGGGSSAGAGSGGGSPPFRGSGARPPRFLRQILRPFGAMRRSAPRRARAQPQVVNLPDYAEREIVAIGLTPADRATLEADGYAILSEERLEALDQTVLKLRIPDGLSLDDARDAVRAINDAATADFNHFYRASAGETGDCEGPACAPLAMVNWPLGDRTCRPTVTIGMVDTGINGDHAIFEGADLEVLRIADEADPSGRQHGTAVAALIVGNAAERTRGLLPDAGLIAVDAFVAEGEGERAAAYDVVRAVDLLIGRDARILNLSLAGDANLVLERMVRAAVDAGAVVVAAAGNDGARAEPRFPAAYPDVLAVTAVDRRGRVYRRAVQGDHIDLAAPGVDIWTAASISGARTKTGTSFAAPFVTAAAALILHEEPGLSPAEVAERLVERAADAGEPGRDPVFGAGLLDAAGMCGARVETAGK